MRFTTKIIVVLRDDLPTWQQLNMTAFLSSGIAATASAIMGEPYEDAAGRSYLPMFRQPVLVFGASAEQISAAYGRAVARDLQLAIFTEQLFSTGHDEANRAAVRELEDVAPHLTGFAFCAERKVADAVVKGIPLHQ
ncbi:DUF2000 domain-containing protein [Chloroflexia bacterium SDU3-3]|nr:DUF2000 domain-containing protein [Chloroflexia bacterium SDU3-3]